jgi:integration host factor subunit beta
VISLARGAAVEQIPSMTRSQLIDAVALKLGMDRATAERAVRLVFDSMAQALRRGEGIELRGFGSFSVRAHPPYRGRNPRSGEAVLVDAKRSAVFRVGRPLRQRIEQSHGAGKQGHGAGERGRPNLTLVVSDRSSEAGPRGPLAGGPDRE